MAFTLIDKQWSISDFIHEYVCDTESDAAKLPECRPGSKAMVIEGGKIYIVNSAGERRLFG